MPFTSPLLIWQFSYDKMTGQFSFSIKLGAKLTTSCGIMLWVLQILINKKTRHISNKICPYKTGEYLRTRSTMLSLRTIRTPLLTTLITPFAMTLHSTLTILCTKHHTQPLHGIMVSTSCDVLSLHNPLTILVYVCLCFNVIFVFYVILHILQSHTVLTHDYVFMLSAMRRAASSIFKVWYYSAMYRTTVLPHAKRTLYQHRYRCSWAWQSKVSVNHYDHY